MFGKMVETSGRVSNSLSGRCKLALGLIAGCSLLGGGSAMGQTTTLFTTVEDFTGWTNGGGSPVTSFGPVTAATYDSDGSSVNGLGNQTNPGGAGTPGSMQINTGGNAIGYTYTVFSPNVLYNTAVMSVLDPGVTPLETSMGDTVNASNTMYVTYTVPNFTGPDDYYQFGVDIAYAPNYYQTDFESSLINDGVIDGLQTETAVIPYSIVAQTSGGALTISPFFNAGVYGSGINGIDNTINGPFYVDNIQVAGAVPEPATLGVLGTGLAMLTLRRRRQA